MSFDFLYENEKNVFDITANNDGTIKDYDDPKNELTEGDKEQIRADALRFAKENQEAREERYNMLKSRENERLYDEQRADQKEKTYEKIKELQVKMRNNERFDTKDIDFIFASVSTFYNKLIYVDIPKMRNLNDITKTAFIANYERLYGILQKYYTNKRIRKDYKDKYFKDFLQAYQGRDHIAEMFDTYPF